MKILTGEMEPSKGSVTRPKKIGILRQDQFAFDAFRVLDTVIMGNAPLWDALQEREKFYANPNDWTDEDGMRLGELEGIVGDQGGYTAEADAATLLQGLDIPEALHERKMSELQSGQKVRVLLAQALFSNATVLLLDEPTNNLDLDSVHWLQRYLLAYTGCLLVISHDRHFLNEVCTHTADIDYQSIITYTGAYDDMVLAKTQIRARVEAGNAQREKKIAQLNEFIAEVLGRHPVLANHLAQEGSGAAADLGAREIEHPAPLYPVSKRTSFRAASSGSEGTLEILRRSAGDSELQRVHRPRRKNRAAGPQRRREDHHAAVAAAQCNRIRRCAGSRISGRRRRGHLGP